ncbi:MAG: hypothetical protein IJR54_09340 [Oscillibacter sp.]|nr:hypothetical protein [Oscillibacter sp.]
MARVRVNASAGFYVLLVWFAAVNGPRPLLTVLAAALVHECGHLAALRSCDARVTAVRFGVCGAVLESDCVHLSYGQELFCVLAGPGANLFAAALVTAAGNPWPAFTGANLILCAFNLLPVRPLDGGRGLELLLSWAAGPAAGEYAARWVSAAGALVLASGLVYVMRQSGGSLWLLPAAAGLLAVSFRECVGRA